MCGACVGGGLYVKLFASKRGIGREQRLFPEAFYFLDQASPRNIPRDNLRKKAVLHHGAINVPTGFAQQHSRALLPASLPRKVKWFLATSSTLAASIMHHLICSVWYDT